MVRPSIRGRARVAVLTLAAALPAAVGAGNEAADTIARIKASVVAVGTFQPLRNPSFAFAGTGFAVGDGLQVVTNDHVVPKALDATRKETLAIAVRHADGSVEVRPARQAAADPARDLAVLEIRGKPLRPLKLGDSTRVREGETYLFTGYPIGAVLGLYPVTHRTMIAAITPIAIPAPSADKLDARSLRQLAGGPFTVFQLDGTAYPGNSGSPVYDPRTGEVIGIVNSVLVKATRESLLTQPSGITYAIPSQRLSELMR